MWIIVRMCGIVVGIATLLRLATMQGLVTYDPLFREWMDRLRDIVELGFLTDVIKLGLDRAIDWVKSFGWHALAELGDSIPIPPRVIAERAGGTPAVPGCVWAVAGLARVLRGRLPNAQPPLFGLIRNFSPVARFA